MAACWGMSIAISFKLWTYLTLSNTGISRFSPYIQIKIAIGTGTPVYLWPQHVSMLTYRIRVGSASHWGYRYLYCTLFHSRRQKLQFLGLTYRYLISAQGTGRSTDENRLIRMAYLFPLPIRWLVHVSKLIDVTRILRTGTDEELIFWCQKNVR
jgi:hypothetical protein